MKDISRRNILALTAAGGLMTAARRAAKALATPTSLLWGR